MAGLSAERLIPPAFVFLWSTGFVTARLVAGHTEPFTFLIWRFAIAGLVLAAVSGLAKVSWPRGPLAFATPMFAGVLIHGAYLGGVFWSVEHGLPAGVSALIASLQPILTAALARPLLGETVSLRRWCGIAAASVGALLVISPKLGLVGEGAIPVAPAAICFLGMVALTLGTFFQKRFGGALDMRAGIALQYAGACVLLLPFALVFEQGRIEPIPQVMFGLAWSIFGMSIVAILMLLHMIRKGAVAAVSSLFFLVPALSSLMAFLMFGERLTLVQILGLALAVIGVCVASRG
ncbi:Threonine/homoserine efflux transporter RhtA [Rhizobiales bacterium GAS191]|jgi:drug/metabolite transporter (DMT)-like permease|nr:Threonine/homoserine efflux transporter RhtA [Rhizobiales bacterium GAS113]SEC36803.1 Threonine/homoserine efflux transporter RhtA [Rhizobiales bacterium GAS188]SEC90591.1 Threonine/homoserine efflux transporter RhtA [Rhizobiales bacterium GAS191]